jgi:hypothetical protein
VSFAHTIADYNGHWGLRELCDICPAALCAAGLPISDGRDGRPHRALGDAIGAALLLAALIGDLPGSDTLSDLQNAAGLILDNKETSSCEPAQPPLWSGGSTTEP